jgi:hypothetical protein
MNVLRGAAGRGLNLDPSTALQLGASAALSTAFLLGNVQPQVIIHSIADNKTQYPLLIPDVMVEEQSNDQMVLTDHPVEQGTGAFITDHAYRMPAELMLTYGWSPGGPQNQNGSPTFLQDLYQQVLTLQQNPPTLVTVYTSKRVYKNMLIQTVTVTNDRQTENALLLRIGLREIMIAATMQVAVSLDPTTLADPESSLGEMNRGTVQLQDAPTMNFQNYNQNFLSDLPDAAGGLP